MTLEQIYLVSEIFAAAAVVISLVFVGLQLRHNTEQLRISTAAGYYDIYRDHNLCVTNPEFAGVFLRGFDDFESLNENERTRLFAFYAVITRGYQTLHYQASKKIFDGDLWENTQNHLADLLLSEGHQQYWATRRHHFNPSFQTFVHEIIANRDKKRLFRIDENEAAPSAGEMPAKSV